MKRISSTVAGTFGLALLLIGVAPVAHADVTNPADNPHKITVKGDDGQTYVDGQDTLPGYDDEECTYIPGAWLDFDNNLVHYADGQTIPWTEWDRSTGYKEWLKDHPNGGSSGGSTGGSSGGSSGGTTGGTTGGSTSGGTKTGGTKTGGTKTGTTKTGSTSGSTSGTTSGTKAGTTSVSDGPTAGASADPSAVPSVSPSASSAPSISASPQPSAGVVLAESSATPEAAAASGASAGASGAGIAILGVLAAVGALGYGVHWFVRRRSEGGLA